MTDRYERIRAALAMGPTPGPWEIKDGRTDTVENAQGYPVCTVHYHPNERYGHGSRAAYIAACDPDTIRELLTERDQMSSEIEALKGTIAALEADRKRRGLTGERIRIIWKETKARMGCGDPVLWFARAIERAHGISAPQPTESCESLISDKTACGSESGDCDSQPAEPDLVRCAECGAELIPVRPGKWQHPDCSQSSWAAEPVKVPSDDLAHEIWAAAQTAPGEGIEDAVERIAALLARYGQPAEPEK